MFKIFISQKLKEYLLNKGTVVGVYWLLFFLLVSYQTFWQKVSSTVFSTIILLIFVTGFLLIKQFSNKKIQVTIGETIFYIFVSLTAILLFLKVKDTFFLYYIRMLILYSCGFFIGQNLAADKNQNYFLVVIYLVASILSLYIFCENLFLYQPFGSIINFKYGFSNSSFLACYLSCGWIVGLFFLIKTSSELFRLLIILSLILMLVVIFSTSSRAALLMIAIGISFFFKIKPKFLVFIFLFLFAFFLSFKQESIKGRLLIWKVSSEIITDHALTGIGFNRFGGFYNNYQSKYIESGKTDADENKIAGETYFAFNLPIKVLSELGVFLSFTFFLLIIIIFRTENTNSLVKIIFLALIFFSFFSYPLNDDKTAFLFFAFLGILSTYSKSLFFFNRKIFNISNSLIILVSIFYVVHSISVLKSFDKWQNYENIRGRSSTLALKLHKDLYSSLNGTPEFLFNYGTLLYEKELYREALIIFQRCKNHIPSSNLYTYIAQCQENLGRPTEAEKNHLTAVNMVPKLIVPKYYMFEFYRKNSKLQLADSLADEILKIPNNNNPKHLFVKNEIKSYKNMTESK